MGQYADWQDRALASLGLSGGYGSPMSASA
jgi:hypothetical protein